jgi:glycosyltransferase involved in cell wall biosynthesis
MKEEVSAIRSALQNRDLWLIYHGSIVPTRFPPTILHALSLLPKSIKIRIVGYETVGHRGYCRELQHLAIKLQLGARVELLDAMPRKQLLGLCRKSDVGIAFISGDCDDLNQRNMVGASNKVFDYLACGLPALVSALPDWRDTYVAPGFALACDPSDPKGIATALDWFHKNRPRMRAMGEHGRQRILSEWNYENQFAPVLERMEKIDLGCEE